MNYLTSFFTLIGNIFRYHKLKILFLFGSTLFCFLLLFPYGDLSDFASAQISAATRNQVNVQFDDIGFGLMPQLGVMMSKVSLDAAMGPTRLGNIKIDSLGVAPNLMQSLINNIRGRAKLAEVIAMISKVSAQGLFGGDIDVYIAKSNKLGPETPGVRFEVTADKIDLKDLSDYAKNNFRIPVTSRGQLTMKSDMVVDPIFKEEPVGKYELNIKGLNIPRSTVPIDFNGVPMNMDLPGLKLEQVKLRGKIEDKRFVIEEGKLGTNVNEMFGEITGNIELNVRPGGTIDPGAYDLVVDLNLKDAMLNELGAMGGIIDGFLSSYKNKTTNGVRYNFRIKGTSMGAGASPPRISGP